MVPVLIVINERYSFSFIYNHFIFVLEIYIFMTINQSICRQEAELPEKVDVIISEVVVSIASSVIISNSMRESRSLLSVSRRGSGEGGLGGHVPPRPLKNWLNKYTQNHCAPIPTSVPPPHDYPFWIRPPLVRKCLIPGFATSSCIEG